MSINRCRIRSQLLCCCSVTTRTDTEAETPIPWPPGAKSWLTGKDPDAGKDWRWGAKGTAEDEMVGWHHWLNGHGFEWALGVGDGQGGLECCSPWGCKGSDTTERRNWTELNWDLCCCSVSKFCLSLSDPIDWSTQGFPGLCYLPEFPQIHIHCVSDAIWLPHPLLSSPPAFNLSQHQDLFQWVSSLHQVAKAWASASVSVLPMNIQGWFPLGLAGLISLLSKGLSRVFSNTTVQKHQFFGTQPSLWPNSYIHAAFV